MAEYKFDEDSVKALIDWAKSTSFPQSVTLSDAENIVDVKRFAVSYTHLACASTYPHQSSGK